MEERKDDEELLDKVLDAAVPFTPEIEEKLEKELLRVGTRINIFGFDFVCTCFACPEQYDIYFNDRYVAYLRKRHGHLAAYPVIDGEIQWDNAFYKEESGDPYDGVIENRVEVFKNITREIKKHFVLPK
jgi:hypothetical protein